MKNKITIPLILITMLISTEQNNCLASDEQDSLKTPELKNIGSSKVNNGITLPSNVLYSGTANDSFFTSFNSYNKEKGFFAEVCGGVIGAAAVNIPSSLMFCGVSNCGDDLKYWNSLLNSFLSSLILTPIGVSIGVSLVKEMRKQQSSFGNTLLGSVLGGLAGASVGVIPGIIRENRNTAILGSAIGFGIGSFIGGVKGYTEREEK
ncbi:MAG: hypothetical protein PHX21_03145 [bacterium]|nr:hypothetical protein [bacterium]